MSTLLPAGANMPLPSDLITVAIQSDSQADISVFGLNNQDKIVGEEYVLFAGKNQSPNKALTLKAAGKLRTVTARIKQFPADLEKVVIAVSVEAGSLSNLNKLQFGVLNGKEVFAKAQVTPSEHIESALILCALYKRQGQWKIRFVKTRLHRRPSSTCAKHARRPLLCLIRWICLMSRTKWTRNPRHFPSLNDFNIMKPHQNQNQNQSQSQSQSQPITLTATN